MKQKIFAFLTAGIWISLSEFTRNELVLKSYWLKKYADLGIIFPSASMNNAFWGIWSFTLSGIIVFLTRRLRFIESVVVVWIMAFVMMWLVIGNLNVLPIGILIFAIPWSIIEVIIAAFISKKINP